MQTVNSSPIKIIGLTEGHSSIAPGTSGMRKITIKNLEGKPIAVDLWIVATDEKSKPLPKWCRFTSPIPLKLDPNADKEIEFSFDVPLEAEPGLYHYAISFEATTKTSRYPIQYPQQLQVAFSDELSRRSTPEFVIQPFTSSTKPHPLKIGETLKMNVQVKNRSKRVDRFTLLCLDSPAEQWYSVRYPESKIAASGLVSTTDGLELNPEQVGEIELLFHPPKGELAGLYFPTIRLISDNEGHGNSDSDALLDVVYIQILEDDRFDAEILPPRYRTIPAEAGEFKVRLLNQGNIKRMVEVEASDREGIFRYIADQSNIIVIPHRSPPHCPNHDNSDPPTVTLKAIPRKWWRRPLWGKGMAIEFNLALQEVKQDAQRGSEYQELLSLANSGQGTILWQPRPLWLLLLLLLPLLAGLAVLGGWLWQRLFAAPLPPPTITQFETIAPTQDTDIIPLNWTINQFDQVESVVLTRLDNNAEAYRKNYTPSQLRQQCELSSADRSLSSHSNRSKWTRLPPWIGQLSRLFPGNANPTSRVESGGDLLSCEGVTAPTAAAGSYVFQLQVFANQSNANRRLREQVPNSPTDVATTDTIDVAPPEPLPTIVEFISASSSYGAVTTPDTDSNSASPPPIRLNWEITSPSQIAELKLVSLTADGSVSDEVRSYSFRNGVPAELAEVCSQSINLICREVPTNIRNVGSYQFQLMIIPQSELQSPPIIQATPIIQIRAQLPRISSFRVNEQEVLQAPKQIYSIDPQTQPDDLTLSWQVEPTEGVQVELLPAPGPVPLEGTMPYPLSQSPRRETITLRVTNAAGEQVSQTVVIETARSIESAPSPAATNEETPSIIPELELAPIELPPRPN
jgi:hypothetical protein